MEIDRYGDAAAAFSKYMKSTVGGWIGQGDFVLNPSEATCFYVQACQQQENIFYLLGLWLHHKGHGNEWVWSQWSWPNDVNHVSALAETRLVDFCKVTFAQDVDVITLIR